MKDINRTPPDLIHSHLFHFSYKNLQMTTVINESKYKSFMRPVKFWQKSTNDNQREGEECQDNHPESNRFLSFGKKQVKKPDVIPWVESDKKEVYKLSTVDASGIYMPPSPTLEGKRDHWIDVAEDMEFNLPHSECLTSHWTEKHDFFTPSTLVQSQPYILPCLSSSISLSTDASSVNDSHLELTPS